MKNKICKFLGNAFVTLNIIFALWFGLSYLDIIWDNTTTAEHSKHNLIVMLVEKADSATVEATVVESNDGNFTLFDKQGEEWFYEGEPNSLLIGQTVKIKYQKMGTENPYDDEIISVSKI